MKYFSLNNESPKVDFKEAVIKGLAPDRGLYFPEQITPLPESFFKNIENFSDAEIAFTAIRQFVGNSIPNKTLKNIIKDTLCFDFPLVNIEKDVFSLELFHGPTMAFKDVGARFMARCLGYFYRTEKNQTINVLVATSGDTGGAVASGFLGVEKVNVVILYPLGKVSDIQERQLTTLGKNISALAVDGVFDDCQEMVKTAFLDPELNKTIRLTSANSINVARWLPQMFYYFIAYKRLKLQGLDKQLVFSVPSGNFGNICAGILAQKLGLPISHFVAATNTNDTIPQYLKTGEYQAKPSKSTLSSAMDVGNPSNFTRVQKLVNNDITKLKTLFSAYSFNDKNTKKAMKQLYKTANYIADPHGAVGYLGLKKYMESEEPATGVFLETAHPVKFLEIVEKITGKNIEIPAQIEKILNAKKQAIKIKHYAELKGFLIHNNRF